MPGPSAERTDVVRRVITDRRAPLVWLAVIAPAWVVLALCAHWAPIVRDSWGHVRWHRLYGLTAGHLWWYAKGAYLHNNPRLGQVLTLLLFTPGPWHVLVTPVIDLALFVLLTTIALGRWPSPRRTDDALVFATILALVAATSSVVGPMLVYRPYVGNYLCGLAISLALAVPYRLHAETPRAWGWLPALPMLALGFAAGMCNEHTGPAFAAALVFAIAAFVRRGERPRAWMIAGLVGLVAGGLALYFAPGQDIRYNGMATQHGLVGRIISRGIVGDLEVLGGGVVYLAPMLAWVVLGVRAGPGERSRARAVAERVALGTALLTILTLLASPKQGGRLYFASTALVCVALASWLVPRLAAPRARGIAWGMAAAVLAFVGWRCVHAYRSLAPEYAARIAALAHAPHGGTVTVPAYTVGRSHWFLGDDFVLASARHDAAELYGLGAIELANHRDATGAADDP